MPCPTCGASDARDPFDEAREISTLRARVAELESSQAEHDREVRDRALEEATSLLIASVAEEDEGQPGEEAAEAFNALSGKSMNERLAAYTEVLAKHVRALKSQAGKEKAGSP